MPSIFVESLSDNQDTQELTGEAAHYLLSVLRGQKGDEVILHDRAGKYFQGVITGTTRKSAFIEGHCISAPDTESPLDLILCQGLLKGYKMDMVIQKSTELGVKRIIPLITARCEVRYTRKGTRWDKIALEASRQAGRPVIPEISQAMSMTEVAARIAEDRATGFIFYEEYGAVLTGMKRQQQEKRPVHVMIGPEGGFTRDEVETACAAGLQVVSLGKRILRAETAAVCAVALVQYLLGDLCTR